MVRIVSEVEKARGREMVALVSDLAKDKGCETIDDDNTSMQDSQKYLRKVIKFMQNSKA